MRDLLIKSQRITGGRKPITVIDPSRVEEFFQRLRDSDLPLLLKAFIAVSLSGGLRVSETLSLRPCNISDGIAKIKVLKKKVTVYREFNLHPIAQELLNQIKGVKNYARYFSFNRNTVYKQIKRVFGNGTSPHSIARHSHISYLLHTKNINHMKVARLMEINSHVVASYNHLNTRTELKKIWK